MQKSVVFIQGGGSGAYEADKRLAESLQAGLGSVYRVLYPPMPQEDRPVYGAWKARIEAELDNAHGEVYLVGHSLGGSFVLKYLSEAEPAPDPRIVGVFIIAAPYWGTEDWEVEAYALQEGFASRLPRQHSIVFYHSRDDEWVPYGHMGLYAAQLPKAVFRSLEGRGHQLNHDLSELAEDIRSMR